MGVLDNTAIHIIKLDFSAFVKDIHIPLWLFLINSPGFGTLNLPMRTYDKMKRFH